MHFEVYTDGSATTKEKPGGYGYVIVKDGVKYSEGSGHIEKGTNNDAELQAAIEGLKFVQETFYTPAFILNLPSGTYIHVTLVSDSQIVLGWASGTYAFRQETKIDKYKQLQMLMHTTKAQTRWVEGHTGDEHNERCDKLANAARKCEPLPAEKLPTGNNEISAIVKQTTIGTKTDGIICFWFKDVLKVIDLNDNIVEDYHPEHGKRSSSLELQGKK